MTCTNIITSFLLLGIIIEISQGYRYYSNLRTLRPFTTKNPHKSQSTTQTTAIHQDIVKSDVSIKQKAADTLLGGLFSIKPLFRMVASKARDRMINQANAIGVDWLANVANYEKNMDSLRNIFDTFNQASIVYPSYYLKPFHAYDTGNLNWQAAMEVESASYAVHAHIFSSNLSSLSYEADGDYRLRDNFHKVMLQEFQQTQFQPKRIVDIGCSGGLSSLKLHESFPSAEIIGMDLSPYMLSVAKYDLTKQRNQDAAKYITYIHGMGEQVTNLNEKIDMISMCLICHELPSDAARKIFQSSFDSLSEGGVLTLMDMDPKSPRLQKLTSNPFAFAGFKSTEPWIQEYLSLDLPELLKLIGYRTVKIQRNSPQHRTIIAYK